MGFFTGTLLVIGGAAIGNEKSRKKIMATGKALLQKGSEVTEKAVKKGKKVIDDLSAKIAENEEIYNEAKKIVEKRKEAAAKKEEKKDEELPKEEK